MTGPRSAPTSPDPVGDDDAAYVLYDELARSRDRLADLGRRTELPLPDGIKAKLRAAARDRDLDLFVTAVALVAQKLARRAEERHDTASQADRLREILDELTFDHRVPKAAIIALFRDLKADLDARITHVRDARAPGYAFPDRPEAYADRPSKSEKPDQFFRRVYAAHVARGMTQADIRRADPAFYNVFHVWCSRHKKPMSGFVPATRPRR